MISGFPTLFRHGLFSAALLSVFLLLFVPVACNAGWCCADDPHESTVAHHESNGDGEHSCADECACARLCASPSVLTTDSALDFAIQRVGNLVDIISSSLPIPPLFEILQPPEILC